MTNIEMSDNRGGRKVQRIAALNAVIFPTNRIMLNVMTLKVTSSQVNSVQGVPISVTGIAQVENTRPLYRQMVELVANKFEKNSSFAAAAAQNGAHLIYPKTARKVYNICTDMASASVALQNDY